MTTVRTRGILFDMDGVLVDSSGPVRRSWNKWLTRCGRGAEDIAKVAHGRRAIDTIRAIAPELDAEAELRVTEEFECNDLEGLIAMPGAAELLQQLPQGSWTVVTSATPRLARIRLEAVGIVPPPQMITADMVQNGKPDPEPYMKGAQLLGLSPHDCIVVEDAPSGMEAAHRAGCRVLAVLTTHTREEMSGAEWIVEGLSEVSARAEGGSIELSF